MQHLGAVGVEYVQAKITAHLHTRAAGQHHVAENADKRLVDAVVKKLCEGVVNDGALLVSNNARQHGDRARAAVDKGAHAGIILRHQHDRDIDIVRAQLSKLGRELLSRAHLKDRARIADCRDVIRRGRHRQAAALRLRAALLAELRDETAAEIIDRGRCQEESGVGFCLIFDHTIGCAADLGHLVGQIGLCQPLVPGRLGYRAVGGRAMAVIVKGDGLDVFSLADDRIEVDRHAVPLAIGVLFPRCGEQPVDLSPVRVLADAEHVLLIALEIALREALAGKSQAQRFHVVTRHALALVQNLGIDSGDNADILGALHAPFDLDAADARVLELLQMLDQAVVLERHRIIVHIAAETVLHAAGLGAHAAVAAAPADQGRHIALTGMAEAERAVDKNLGLDARVPADKPDLLKTQLAGEHGAGKAHLGRGLDPGETVNAHLGAGVQRDIRHSAVQTGGQAEILHQYRVGPHA